MKTQILLAIGVSVLAACGQQTNAPRVATSYDYQKVQYNDQSADTRVLSRAFVAYLLPEDYYKTCLAHDVRQDTFEDHADPTGSGTARIRWAFIDSHSPNRMQIWTNRDNEFSPSKALDQDYDVWVNACKAVSNAEPVCSQQGAKPLLPCVAHDAKEYRQSLIDADKDYYKCLDVQAENNPHEGDPIFKLCPNDLPVMLTQPGETSNHGRYQRTMPLTSDD